MATTTNYNIELVTTQMSQKEVVLNDAFITLDGVVYTLQQATQAAIDGNTAAKDAILAAISASETDIINAVNTKSVDLTPVAKTTELNAAESNILSAINSIPAPDLSAVATTTDLSTLATKSDVAVPSGTISEFRRSKVPAGWTIVADPSPTAALYNQTLGSCVFSDFLAQYSLGTTNKMLSWRSAAGVDYIFLIPPSTSTSASNIVRINMSTYEVQVFTGAIPAGTSTAMSAYPLVNPADGKFYILGSGGYFYRFTPTDGSSITVESLAVTSSNGSYPYSMTIASNGDVYAIGYSSTVFRRWSFSTGAWTNLASVPTGGYKGSTINGDIYTAGDYLYSLNFTGSGYYVYTISTNAWNATVQSLTPSLASVVGPSYPVKAANGDDLSDIYFGAAGVSATQLSITNSGTLSVTTLSSSLPAGFVVNGFNSTNDMAQFFGLVVGAEQFPRRAVFVSTVPGQSRLWEFNAIGTADTLVKAEKN